MQTSTPWRISLRARLREFGWRPKPARVGRHCGRSQPSPVELTWIRPLNRFPLGAGRKGSKMKVAVDMLEPVREPYLRVYPQHLVRMLLRPGSIEEGRRRSAMRRVTYSGGEVGLCCRHMEHWLGSSDLHLLSLSISDAALNATCDGTSGGVELRPACKLVDARVSALVAAVNAERIAGFPSGRLFLDSVEHALAVALVNNHAVRHYDVPIYRGGLGPARLRRITELVHAEIEDELSLDKMAETAGL